MHFNTIVQGQYCPIMFLIINILFGQGLYSTPTIYNWYRQLLRGLHFDLGGCALTLVSHQLQKQCHGILIHFSASRWTDLSKVTIIFNL